MPPPEESSAAGGAPSTPGESLPTTLSAGTIIAERYRIDALLGEGGMGKVYAGEHVHIQKKVAIKVLHEEMSSTPEYVARFEREAIAAAKISHPNVAAATDFGRLPNGSFYIVLEYVAGTDLRTILSSGPLPRARAVRIVRQIASAVGAAHAVGIIHRDLKPENVMVVDREGDPDCVKVLDFGIAKFDVVGSVEASRGSRSAETPLTKIGAIFGTPDYMSPEQALGQTIDPRSDLYSIGVIFHELLTGERLFKGGAVTLMRSHVLEEAPPLPDPVARAAGPSLVAVIRRLLQKSPGDRYANAAELISALDAAMTDEGRSETAKTAAFPLIAPRIPAPQEPEVVRHGSEAFIDEPPPRRRGSLGLWLLMLIAAGGTLVYFFGPPQIVGALVSRAIEASSFSPSTQAPPAPATPSAASARVESAPATPAPPVDPAPSPEESPPSSEEIAEAGLDASPVASADSAPPPLRPSATHAPPKPSAKPVHKPPPKPTSPARHFG